jgi:hypothetical protein
MKIKVTDDALLPISDALDRANGKAQKHTALPGDIFALAARAEESLISSGLPTRERAGAEVIWHGAGPTANAYGYRMTRTRVILSRGRNNWFLTGLERVGVYPRQSELYRITISPAQRERVVATALRSYQIRDDAKPSTVSIAEMA